MAETLQKIEWDDTFCVGNAEIDKQHKKWVGLYNEIIDYFDRKERGKRNLDIMATLKSMLDYTQYHYSISISFFSKAHHD